MPGNHYEMISARKYYGKHATGSVLLCNGQVLIHAESSEVNKFYKKLLDKQARRSYTATKAIPKTLYTRQKNRETHTKKERIRP